VPEDPKPKKIAVVGGGCAAMAAAWDLTSRDNPLNKSGAGCQVTIFQMGGRLGGKGASSRNQRRGYRDRIEEHGLHLWLGYYENAFRMIRTCFEELKARGDVNRQPFDNWNWLSAFERANLVGLADDSSGDWEPWVARFPEYVPKEEERITGIYRLRDESVRPGVHIVDDAARAYPGEPPVLAEEGTCEDGEDVCLERPNVAFFLTHALRELLAFMDSLQLRMEQLFTQPPRVPSQDPGEILLEALGEAGPAPVDDDAESTVDVPRLLRVIRLALLVPAVEALSAAARVLDGPLPYQSDLVVPMLDRFIDAMHKRIERFVQRDVAARQLWELIDLLTANIRGIIAAGLEGHADFRSLDEWNYIDWLRMNRIAERTLSNPIIRGAHDLGFAYRDGDARDPQIAAGQAISAGCRFFFMYKGALFWRMKAGMGDVVFAPMYIALRNRGVKFRFFHRLDEIHLDGRSQAVSALTFGRQVPLKQKDPAAPTNYEPLISVGDMPCWRRQPDADQFDFDDAMREKYTRLAEADDPAVNFESIWCNWPDDGEETVAIGDGADFDAVIVTVPIAALGRVSQQVANSRYVNSRGEEVGPRWTAMLEELGTVATQSIQLWVNRDTPGLGWMRGQVSFSAFVHPFDTWADLSHLIEVETRDAASAANTARGVHYFCSTLPEWQIPEPLRVVANRDRLGLDDTTLIAEAQDVVRENARYFLDDWVYQLWPDAVHRYPTAFKWEILVDPGDRSGAERLLAQHVAANVDPSERYTLSLPGTTQYRWPPDQEVVPNLFVAGDWTDSGLNIGCVEAAVMSGRLASSGISGYPDKRLVPGFSRRTDRVTVMQGGY
jgi:uncharacterized protein with NAD-binding domain and iron-sulfur cluster